MSHSAIGILFHVELAGRRPEQASDPLIPYCQGPSSMPRTRLLENGSLGGGSHLCRKPASSMGGAR